MADAFLRAPLAGGLAFAVCRDQCLAEQLLEVRLLTVGRKVREAWRARSAFRRRPMIVALAESVPTIQGRSLRMVFVVGLLGQTRRGPPWPFTVKTRR